MSRLPPGSISGQCFGKRPLRLAGTTTARLEKRTVVIGVRLRGEMGHIVIQMCTPPPDGGIEPTGRRPYFFGTTA